MVKTSSCILLAIATASGLTQRALSGDLPTCDEDVVLQVMFAVDNTASMDHYISNLQSELPRVLKTLNEDYPGSEFGLISFNDILGECDPQDGWFTPVYNYCNKLEIPLSQSIDNLSKKLSKVAADFGDYFSPEDSLGTMASQSNNPEAGWKRADETTQRLKKVMLVVTDSNYRVPFDSELSRKCRDIPANDGNWDYKCGKENFYTEEQAAWLIRESAVMPVIMTISDHAELYRSFFSRYGVQGYVVNMGSDPSTLSELIRSTVGDIACSETPPTVPPTSPPTTVTTIATTVATTTPATTTTTEILTTTIIPVTTVISTTAISTTAISTTELSTTIAEPTAAPTTIPAPPAPPAEQTPPLVSGGRGDGSSNKTKVAIAVGAAGGGAALLGLAGGLLYRRAMTPSNPLYEEEADLPDDLINDERDREQAAVVDEALFD